ncbi:MAG: hypothetical protein AAF587_07495 [Bacteroidota bacterium]
MKKKKEASSTSHTHTPKSVSEGTINQQLDALFEDPNAEKHYNNLWKTIQNVFKHGLDYKEGNPIKGIATHLKHKVEELHEQYHDSCGEDMWGTASKRKKRKTK